MLDQISGWIKQVTNIGLGLIALGVVLQILFGATIPFMPMDVIGSVVALVKALGSVSYTHLTLPTNREV